MQCLQALVDIPHARLLGVLRLMFSAFFRVLPAALLVLVIASEAPAVVLVDTSKSPHSKLQPVGVDEVRWTDGFWAERTRTCLDSSIPSMWKLMKDGTYKPFLEHFLIVAGKAEGGHHGAKWNDGDFYKWLEAALIAQAVEPDAERAAAIEEAVAAITAAQREDGYLHTPVLIAQQNGQSDVRPFQDRLAFEMYNMGHLITTGCLHYRVTGKQDLLDVAEKAADFMIRTFENPTPQLARQSICPSHYMGVIELYRATGKQKYLDLAEHFMEMRSLVQNGGDDNQDRVPFAEQREVAGHAVRSNYLNAGAADLLAETGDESLKTPLLSMWSNMVSKKLYITGGCGALYDGASPDGSPNQSQITRIHQAYGRNYQLPNITAHNETCANIGNLLWSWRMFQVEAEAKYMDVLEMALYNSILSGVSLAGDEYFYVNPLRVVDPLPTTLRFPRTRQKFFTSFCCPPNVVRTIAEVGGYAYSKSEDTVWVNLYGSNVLTTTFRGERLKLVQRTNYPWDGKVEIEILECPSQAFWLALRTPAWSGSSQQWMEGKPLEVRISSGYQSMRVEGGKPNQKFAIELDMQSRLMQADPLVEELTNQVAVMRGPLVYCLESPELPNDVELEQVLVPLDTKFQPQQAAELLGGVTVLEGTALAETPQLTKSPLPGGLYRSVGGATTNPIPLRLIPYYAWANRGPTEMTVWLPAAR